MRPCKHCRSPGKPLDSPPGTSPIIIRSNFKLFLSVARNSFCVTTPSTSFRHISQFSLPTNSAYCIGSKGDTSVNERGFSTNYPSLPQLPHIQNWCGSQKSPKTTMVAETAEAQFRNYTVAACLWNFYMIFTGVLFFCLRKKDFIRKRNVPACMTQVFFSVAVGNQWLARSTLWPAVVHSIPWIVSVALNYMCDINWMFSYFFRTVVLLNEYYANKSASTNFKKSALKKEEAVYQHLSLNKAEKFIFRVQKRLFNRKDNKFRRFASTTLLGESSGSTILIKRGIGLPQLLKCLAVSTTIEVILFLIVLGYNKAFSIHTLMDPEFTGNGKEWVPLYICVGIFLITLPYFLHLTRNVHDSIYLKLEHTFALASFYPLFLLYILTYFVKSVSELFPFGYTFWLFLLATITHTVTITCPALYTILKGGDERILLENSIDSFHRVLNDPSLFLILKDVLVEDFSIENALFIEECMLLDGTPSAMGSRQHSTFLEEDGTPQRIKFIIDTFIVSGAPYELNISSTARKSILSKLQNPEEPLSATVLEPAKKEIIQLMYHNTYPRLLRRLSNKRPATFTETGSRMNLFTL